MDVCIVGTGYVGLSTAAGFAEQGHRITCVDIDRKRVDDINSGVCPVFEPGMEPVIRKAVKSGQLRATLDLKEAVASSDVIFISVPTPCNDSGRIDTKFIDKASKDIAAAMDGYKVVVVKSTVVPGTTEGVVGKNLAASGKAEGKDFGLAMNPEFLREGHALEDFLGPDRIVIGSADRKAGDAVAKLYAGFKSPLLRTDIKTAEMIKYASNAFLATKITFANEVGNICKLLGIDVYKVMEGVGLDSRIGPKFLRAGCGYGGSCFPKDVQALAAKAKDAGYEPELLDKVQEVNRRQRRLMAEQLGRKMALKGKRVAMLGLAFNPDTDDVRESAAIDTVDGLLKAGASVVAYDPKAMDNFRKLFPRIAYAESAREALTGADACIIATDWDEFSLLSDADFKLMKGNIIIEGRKTLDPAKVRMKYEGVCW
jgi:UDPglucose 6-dehydrogenase